MSSLVEQLKNRLVIIKENFPDVRSIKFLVKIEGSKTNIVDRARQVFEERKLEDLDLIEGKSTFVFEVYLQPIPGRPGIGDFKNALEELDINGIEGIVDLYPVARSI